MYSLGNVCAHGAGALASAGRERPSGCARQTLPSAGHQGMAWGFLQGDSWRGIRCGRFVSCREVGAGHLCGVGSSCRKWSIAVSGHRDRAAQGVGASQSARFGCRLNASGWPPALRRGAYKGPSRVSLSLSTLPCLPLKLFFDSVRHHLDSSFCHHRWTPPPLLRPHDADSTHPPGPASHSVHSLWTPPSQLKPLLHAHGLNASCPKQETTRQLSGRCCTTEHFPQTCWWRIQEIN